MNKELWSAYHDLSKTGRDSLRRVYVQSPVMQKLMELVEQHPHPALSTHVVVEHLYGVGLLDEDFPGCRNRFYKLRKKMLEDIRQLSQGEATEYPEMSEEEVEYYRGRKLNAQNDYANGRTVLERLLKRCEQLCLYELLPGIVDELAVSAGIFNENMEVRRNWARKYEEVTLLLADFHRLRTLNKYLSLDSQDRRNQEKTNEILEQMRRIMLKYPDQPRFAIVYYFAACNIATVAYGRRLHSVRRLLNKLAVLLEEHPDVPGVSSEPGHRIRIHFFRLQMEMIYFWQKKDYETAYQYLCEYWEGVTSNMARFSQLSDNTFRNKANLEIRTQRFDLAEETIFSYIKFLKENGKQNQTASAWSLLAYLYTRAYPQLKPENPDYLQKRLEEYLGILEDGGHPQLRLETACINTDFLFIQGRFAEAYKSFSSASSQAYFQMLDLPEASEFYQLFTELPGPLRKERMKNLAQRLKERAKNNSIEDLEDVLNWFQKRLREAEA